MFECALIVFKFKISSLAYVKESIFELELLLIGIESQFDLLTCLCKKSGACVISNVRLKLLRIEKLFELRPIRSKMDLSMLDRFAISRLIYIRGSNIMQLELNIHAVHFLMERYIASNMAPFFFDTAALNSSGNIDHMYNHRRPSDRVEDHP